MIRPRPSSVLHLPAGTILEQPIDLRGLDYVTVVLKGVTLAHNGPAWLMDEQTDHCTIQDGVVIGCAETPVFGGNRRTQTGGRNRVWRTVFEQTPVILGGVGHQLIDTVWHDTERHALRFGLLEWDKPNTFGVNQCQIIRPTFEDCFTEEGDVDYGVLIAMRDLTQDILIDSPAFLRCGARALYLDDGMSNITVKNARWEDCYRDFWIGGGRHIDIQGFTTGAAEPSRWDNRFSVDTPMGSSFRKHFLDTSKEFYLQHGWVKDAPAWLEHIPHYTEDWANREQWTSQGSLELSVGDGPDPEAFGGKEVEWCVSREPLIGG